MADILYPTKARRFMSKVAGLHRYDRSRDRAAAAARGGVLWIAVCKGWSCNPHRVVSLLATINHRMTGA